MALCFSDEVREFLLLFGFSDGNRKQLKDMVSKVAPTPRTPSTESLRQGQSGGFTSRGTFSFRNKVLEPSKHDLWLLSLHFGGEAAAVELERDGVADLDLGGVAKDGAGGVGGDGVAAFEDFQGAAFFELQREAGEALALGAKQALGANTEVGGAAFEAQAKRSNLH